ncbi:MAG: tyrosinase family protein [Pseudomonadota bacterium]
MRYTRREFLATAAAGASMMSLAPGQAFGFDATDKSGTARYHRYNVNTPQGQRMLESYARGVEAMLKLPPEHPHNWFRNAFVHMMDCPHGNWWFYVWHRGYVGYFERTIRKLSGDPEFAMPYWNWTTQPEIPAGMFEGVLTPTDKAYAPYTVNLKLFTDFIKPSLDRFWNSMSAAQRSQQAARGYNTLDDLWNDVTGYNAAQKTGISGNMAYAITCGARYLSKANPKLDAKTTADVSPHIIDTGLTPIDFYNEDISRSFTSSKTASHVLQPDGATKFSVLEGFPHNKVHNCIGGVGAIDPGPYGNMTNFLSPVDPIFFLHHANMDRLWALWTRKQEAMRYPTLPTGSDLATFMNDPFLFYVDGDGQYVGPRKAGDYVDMSVFDYDYVSLYGKEAEQPPKFRRSSKKIAAIKSVRSADAASVVIPNQLIQAHLSEKAPQTLIAEITMERPGGLANTREFDVIINAPAGVTQVEADSPYYAGTIAFFGPVMSGMEMSHHATFAVPLPKTLQAFSKLQATSTKLDIRLVPSSGQAPQSIPVHDVSIISGP